MGDVVMKIFKKESHSSCAAVFAENALSAAWEPRSAIESVLVVVFSKTLEELTTSA